MIFIISNIVDTIPFIISNVVNTKLYIISNAVNDAIYYILVTQTVIWINIYMYMAQDELTEYGFVLFLLNSCFFFGVPQGYLYGAYIMLFIMIL